MIAVLFVVLGVLMVGGVPIFMSLSGSAALSLGIFSDLDLVVVIQRMIAGLNKFSLMSIPFFILAANLMGEGGISKRIIKLANVFVGHISGGLGMVAILASLFFGAISGSAPATVVAIGAILYPALKANNYGTRYSTGVITAAGSLGIIIPPSVTMIVYGTVTGASVGALFIAGFGAGVIYALIYMIYTYIHAKRHPEIIRQPKTTWPEKWDAIKGSAWGMGVPIIILGGIYGGIFTPTEASAVAVIYSLFVSMVIYREMSFKDLINCIKKSAIATVQIMVLMAGACVFAWILTSEGITVIIADAILKISSNKYVIFMLMNIILLVAGMFLDGASIVTILGPLFFPIAMAAGIDPIHLGIVMVVNCAIGMFTPPFGLNLFVASSITDQPVMKVARGAVPFIFLSIIALLLITYIPEISLWLPRQVYGTW
ncbi:MAG: TRAP transporter large permease [Oscillospiraceae bacterium]